jgi:hypothetical protein
MKIYQNNIYLYIFDIKTIKKTKNINLIFFLNIVF